MDAFVIGESSGVARHSHIVTHTFLSPPPLYPSSLSFSPLLSFLSLPLHTHTPGLAGGSASGKTTVAKRIIESLGVPWVSLLSMDSFYKVLNAEQHKQAMLNQYNFDHPGEGGGG